MRKLSYVALALGIVATLAPLSAQAGCRGPLPPNVCQFLPVTPPVDIPGGADQNVVAVQNTYGPEAITVYQAQKIFFQNLDLEKHDVADANCWSAEAGYVGTCRWATQTLEVGDYGREAEPFTVDTRRFAPGTYNYVCTLHPAMKGSFTVVYPN